MARGLDPSALRVEEESADVEGVIRALTSKGIRCEVRGE